MGEQPPSATLRASDEAFWQAQEKRKQGSLGQPCCTQSKMSWAMIDMPGDFAVVIHGESDCLNCFHHHNGRNAARYFSTRLTEAQITTGETQAPLRHLLRMIADQLTPDAVIVLGTCPVEVIGDRFEIVVDALAEETGIPMIALHTSGLKLSSLTEMQDWLYSTLAKLPQLPPPPEKSLRLGLFGMPVRNPLGARTRAILEQAGVLIHGLHPHTTGLDGWRSVSHADVSAVVDADASPRLVQTLEEQGSLVREIPLPIGVQQSVAALEAIGDALNISEAMHAEMTSDRNAAMAHIARFRATHDTPRIGMAIRMLNTYRSDQLAHDGLGDLPFLLECGFDVMLFIQGPPEEAPRFEHTLRTLGVNCPVRVFPGPFLLVEHFQREDIRLAYAPDSTLNLLRRAGIPAIPSRVFAPWLEGVEHNVMQLESLIHEGGTP